MIGRDHVSTSTSIETYNRTKFVHACTVMRCALMEANATTSKIKAGVINYFQPKIKRTAKFNTDYSCCTRDQDKRVNTLVL